MASVTRSTRRAEALHPHQHQHHHHHHANAHLVSPSHSHPSAAAIFNQGAARNKRALDVADRDFDVIKPKRTRIAVEILAKGSSIANDGLKVPPPQRPKPKPAVATVNIPPAPTTPVPLPPTLAALPPAKIDQNLTKHQAKVINGIRHELDRLQPSEKDTKEQGRKLRSQEATRFRSELSAYFPDYDEQIGNEPKEQFLLNVDTPIIVVDDPRRAVAIGQRAPARPHHVDEYPIRGYGDALFNDVFDAQRIDFSFLEAQNKNKTLEDPLPDKLFQPVHKRAERLERSIRNNEKGRAQHERDQIVRILEGLQGHDWLRVMGVSGITETRKKKFEPARDHFIKGCQAILAKFRNWSLEEKRRKLEKEKALAEQADGDEDEENEEDHDAPEEGDGDADEEEQEEGGGDEAEEKDSSDSLASPANQLQEEGMARSKPSSKSSKKRKETPQPQPPKPPKLPRLPEPPKEFKSFFSKRHERDGAMNRHRRTGRKVLAWGLPIPEIPERDFDLPEEYRDEDTLKTRARRKRRDRREHKH